SGLGLAISREIIALHGGRMWVESEAGRVQFYFSLPIAAPIHAPGRSNGGAEE
ncbi:MAG: PAS domain-containing sensor histidine kinase, partial [Anaerolineae bacterium]|nr:PAS domain-containing sensor histidine kinase [Anaerolineae bacterium]